MLEKIVLPFGKGSISFEIDRENLCQVLTPSYWPPLEDLEGEVKRALLSPLGEPPLWEWVRPSDSVLILSDDVTRLTPVNKLLPALLEALYEAGVSPRRISILMALGTHRPMTEEEMRAKVGNEIYRRFKVFNHNWMDPRELIYMGTSAYGTPLWVNRAVTEASVIIGLGSIVPHHIPGFSGSSKIVQPGICGPVTTAETHLLSTKCDDSLLGLEDNQVRRDMDDMAEKVGMRTILNVVLNPQGEAVGVFFGKRELVFQQGVRLARQIYGIPFQETPDIVVANSCPCDIDFWQSHKALYPACRMVKKGGTIIILTPAPEGVSPVHKDLLNYAAWSSDRIEKGYREGRIKNGVAAALAIAWAKVREKAGVIMVSPGISPQEKEKLGFTHAEDLYEAMDMAFKLQGNEARVSVLSHAPDTLPIRSP